MPCWLNIDVVRYLSSQLKQERRGIRHRAVPSKRQLARREVGICQTRKHHPSPSGFMVIADRPANNPRWMTETFRKAGRF
jgi:hypothetical protein